MAHRGLAVPPPTAPGEAQLRLAVPTEFVSCEQPIEHCFRDGKHHLRLRLRLPAARLVTGLLVAFWFVCLVGAQALPRGYRQQVVSWGTLSRFRLALEFLTWPPPDAWARLDRLLDRLARGIAHFRIDPAEWQLRYRRLRPRYCIRRPLPYRLRRQLRLGPLPL
jgi:hypothetical protein